MTRPATTGPATGSAPADVDLGPAAQRTARLAAAVADAQLDAPTPCAGLPVSGLLVHVLGLARAFAAAAAKQPDPGPAPEPPTLPADWRAVLPAALDALAEAWRAPGAREGTTSAGGVAMPAAAMAAVALDELVLHGWDLARATGQPYRPEPAEVEACLGFVAAAARPEGVPGLFGPPVPVAPDAPALDRLLALSGRDPGWAPPAPPSAKG
jgi:uncharacterized protein (TIGR03086 family)